MFLICDICKVLLIVASDYIFAPGLEIDRAVSLSRSVHLSQMHQTFTRFYSQFRVSKLLGTFGPSPGSNRIDLARRQSTHTCELCELFL